MSLSDYVDSTGEAFGIDILHFLGYVLGAVIIGGIVTLGLIFIKSDGQLVVAMVGILSLLLIAALSCVYMRSQRATRSERKKRYGSTFYEPIPKTEQTLLQLSIVLTIATIILGITIKWPLITSITKEFFGFNG
jgi:hypothetical protein